MLARDYREAEKIRTARRNEYAWLQGLYFYQGLCAASPIFRAFAKKGTKAAPYIDQPIPITKEQTVENKANEDKRVMEKGKRFMEVFALNHNKRMQQEVKQDGRTDH